MTPAIKTLERLKVTFRVHQYTHDENAEAFGLEAAEKLGVDPGRVFKTLVAKTDAGVLVFGVIPVAERLNLKQLAAAVGAKRAELAGPAEAQRATGYIVGGISPLGGKKALPLVLDASAEAHATILVSAGRRGLQVELAPADLLAASRGKLAPLTGQGG